MDQGLEPQNPRGFDAYEMTLGDEMRGERATLGKSLLDVQRDLRIKATYIAAIENCDPSVFQTPGFIAGYVRSYARYLHMDPEACFIRFCEESGFDGVHGDLKASGSLATKSAALLSSPSRPAMADPIARPRIPMNPEGPSLLERISPSALGSVAVLGLLLLGLGYGSWTVLQEVQRVQFTPVNQTPGVSTDIATLGDQPAEQSGSVVRLGAPKEVKSANLEQLYRPQELDVPKMVARDGPIANIDAGSVGAYAETAPAVTTPVEQVVAPVVVADGPPPVDVIAAKAAWVRIYFEDGSVLFEGTLDAGQRYRIPADVGQPLLRAGNAGQVFVLVDDKSHGPVGRSGGVVRDIALGPDAVQTDIALAGESFDLPLGEPLNGYAPTVAAATNTASE